MLGRPWKRDSRWCVGSARILVVEDEALVASEVIRQLERFGHQVMAHTTHGEEAVELAAKLLPDLRVLILP
jgi:CheY-like chemotaxis protein